MFVIYALKMFYYFSTFVVKPQKKQDFCKAAILVFLILEK